MSHRCPQCMDDEVRPSRWRWFELPLALLLLRPLRCPCCAARFWRPRFL